MSNKKSNNKRQEFTDNNRKKGFNLLWGGVLAVVFVAIAFYVLNNDEATGERVRFTAGNFNIGTAYAYEKETSMTRVEPKIEGDTIIFSLEELKEHGLLYTRIPMNDNSYMPLTSFITPTGRVVTAFSMCEPCASDTFRINKERIICESCGTVWTLEDLQGVSGGCLSHPPEEINYEVVGDEIRIPADQVYNWTPRDY